MSIPAAENIIWKKDRLDIPILDLARQAKSPIAPAVKWGTVKRRTAIRGTLHFYTEDLKFSALWSDSTPVVIANPPNLIEVNYSTRPEDDRIEVAYFIYRKRWLSRFWQEYDIPIFVDLHVHERFFDIALMGVPHGWTAYANRGFINDTDHLIKAHNLAHHHAGQDITYVVYGGGERIRVLCADYGWLWIPDDTSVKHGKQPQTTL